LDEVMALKLLKPEMASVTSIGERFRNEMKLARKVTHKNVCRLHDFHEQDDTFFITMEYVPGENLKQFILKKKRLTEKQAIDLAKQICLGLIEAHKLGVVHRDLKPQNILIDLKGQAKIMDFGIARSMEAKGMTQTGTIVGTPEYMSPEQAEGKEASPRSDIYSLGVILYEMVTGTVPFEGDSALSIALKHKTEIPDPPRKLNQEITEDLASVILKCMEKSPEQRYPSAQELLSELRNITKRQPVSAPPKKAKKPAFLKKETEKETEEQPVFVARKTELKQLHGFLQESSSGKGQVVFITGEAGSGKTALIREFARRAQKDHNDLITATGKCNAHTGVGDPYLPFIEILGLLTGDVEEKWAAGFLTKENAAKLWKLAPLTVKSLLKSGPDLVDVFVSGSELVTRSELFSDRPTDWLVQLKKLAERKAALPADSTLQQSTLFEQYTRVIQALSRKHPLLLILDDLQWVDTGSANLLFHLGRQIKGFPILILGSFRPAEVSMGRDGDRHPLEHMVHEFKRDYGDIEVEVGKAEGRAFVDAFLDTEPTRLGEKFRDTLFKQTNGHPLFTIELLRTMQEQGMLVKDKKGRWTQGAEFNWDKLPARVDAVIQERISRLTENMKDVLTMASVEGEEFTAEVVASLQKMEIRDLVRLLSRELDKRHHLVSSKEIRYVDQKRLSLYLFQHILFQRYLYNDLDDAERSYLHEEVGKILEKLYGDKTEGISVHLARHFQKAGSAEKAIHYLNQAGNRAVHLSANDEAISHYKNALSLLKDLPESPERDQLELTLQLALTVPFQASKGFACPEIKQAVTRSRALCQKIKDPTLLFTALVQLQLFYSTQPEYRTALKLQEQIEQIAEQTGDPMQRAISQYQAVWSLLNVGELTQTLRYAKLMRDLYDPQKHSHLAYVFGYDMGVLNRAFGSWALWLLGYPDQALDEYKIALNHARELGHPYTLAFALVGGCGLHWFLKNRPQIDEYTDELDQLSDEKGFIYWKGHSIFYYGEKKTIEGQTKDGISQMRQGLQTMRATGTETCLTRILARMTEACRQSGEVSEGLSAVNEALELGEKYDERYMEAELFRLKGELLKLKKEPEDEVEDLFRKAIQISQKQKAKSWELRAVMSLSRLMKKQGKKKEALKMLQKSYSWFGEGKDRPDLKEAQDLLETLKGS
ncbi:MAG: protein kinase, partial [Candidatus Aminicenantes bacterium]|nr:protein kinase [Candidatus Aminicenantes bacterium]